MTIQLATEPIGCPQRRRRTDRLVGLLRVLDLARKPARPVRQELLAVRPRNLGPNSGERFVAERHAVRTHVGDEATLVQTLRDAHHLRRAEAQLAAALLLQRARHERCLRAAAVGLVLDGPHGHGGRRQPVGQRAGLRLVDNDHTLLALTVAAEVLARRDLGTVERDQRRNERGLCSGEQIEIPIAC